ncbi:MAG: triose-phosphate isomerase [Alphaproteobacteria bacterium]|nr:triose-phosphate isomerase [Alphaproteobacteria bacterium]
MQMRRLLIAGNWKMNGLSQEGKTLVEEISSFLKTTTNPDFDMLVCPPFTLIGQTCALAKDSSLSVGGQDCSFYDKGAHTGEVSAAMLKDIGCSYVIVGHSERRANHGETNEIVALKAQKALEEGLKVIICVGETEQERVSGKMLKVIETQVRDSLPLNATSENTVIAYEPIWAIGTGKTATPEDVAEVHKFIRSQIESLKGKDVADKMRLLYGGSVKPNNAKELLSLEDVDGALVGGASLKSKDFCAIATRQND